MLSKMDENTSKNIPWEKERKTNKDPSHGIENPHIGTTETNHCR